MKIPDRLLPLVHDGILDEVLAQVRSGKEADVFIVRAGEEIRCAKVYKEANQRSFRQAAQYQEGRKVRNSRTARAIGKGSRYGQKEAESSWIHAEVEALKVLSAAGLRVPRPFGFFEGVLVMELVLDAEGEVAPRLGDLELAPETALLYHEELVAQVVKMLCLGIIHGDLSEFNVLVDAEGPVIIDLPQAVNAAGNNSAERLLARDVENLARFFGRFEPMILGLNYAPEIWDLYQKGKLTPHTVLTGTYKPPQRKADVGGVLSAIGDARKEHERDLLRRNPGRAAPRGGAPAQPHRDPRTGGRDGGRQGVGPAEARRPQGDRPPHPHGPADSRRPQGGGPPHRRDEPPRGPQGGRTQGPPGNAPRGNPGGPAGQGDRPHQGNAWGRRPAQDRGRGNPGDTGRDGGREGGGRDRR